MSIIVAITTAPDGRQSISTFDGQTIIMAEVARKSLYESPSYDNAGGKGDRTAILTVTTNLTIFDASINSLVDGDNASNVMWVGQQDTVGKYIKIDFGHLITMDEFSFYSGGIVYNIGVWKSQTSIDDSNYIDVGESYTLFTDLPQVVPCVAVGFRYLRILGISGDTNLSPYLKEVEFKLGNPV